MSSSLRNTLQNRKIRGVVSKHNLDTAAPSKTDDIADAAFKVAREQLIPQAVKRQFNAIKGDQRPINVYFKKTTGRPCSCVDSNNTPEGRCQICFKTGYVGGFDKFGTHSEICDITSVSASYNVRGNYNKRPVTFMLDQDARHGVIIFDLELKQNIGFLDLLQIIDWQPNGTNIVYSVFNGTTWIPLSDENLEPMLAGPIRLKVELNRVSLQKPSPELSHIRIRYNHRVESFVRSDWPHVENSRALSEFGIYTNWQTLTFNMDNTISFITPEDWVYRMDRNEKWKIISSDRFDPEMQLLGHAVTGRLIQPHEVYNFFPL